MSNAKLHSSKNSMLMSWLAKELKREIPEVDLHGQEKSLLDFTYHDLETCLKRKWRDTNSEDFEEALETEDRQEEMKEFLKVWTNQWLEKWRERVTLCQKLPQFSLKHLKAKKKAKKIFKNIENGQELKELIEKKLINEGEICMADLIAENLIVEEIAHRLRINRGKVPIDKVDMDPFSILQTVLPQVKSLTERRIPLIHLRLIIDV